MERSLSTSTPTDLRACFRLQRFGPADPTAELAQHRYRQAAWTPAGPGALEIEQTAETRFVLRGFGPGGPHLLERGHLILGIDDRPEHFKPVCGTVRTLVRKAPGLRLVRAVCPVLALVAVVLQQRVAWKEAALSFRRLVRSFGREGPGGLYLPPSPDAWASIALPDFAHHGVEQKRARTVRRVGQLAHHLFAMGQEPERWTTFEERLRSVEGLGPWSVGLFLGLGLGAPDAVVLGDYDLPHRVAFAFRKQARGDDQLMLQILKPYRGQRFRVIRLLEEAGASMPRFGPRRGSGRPKGRL